ncbi:MAG: M13 family metallopeptidase [Proteobacteria bacterium]|nr:M13 family metallopeptidase [Pseudomonadota bacterium]
MKHLLWNAVIVTAAACSTAFAAQSSATDGQGAAIAPLAAGGAAGKAQIGDIGLDLGARNLRVRPGDDFFTYANGTWIDTFQIPPDRASYGAFHKLDELSKQRVHSIIEQAASAGAAHGTAQQQIGDYYAAFMDQDGIEARGLAPAQPGLQRIAAASSRADIARLFGTLGYASLFDTQIVADFKDPDRYGVFVSESTLGLPDRDYYLKDDPKLANLRAKYVEYVAHMLSLAGVQDAAARARAVMDFETAASKVQWPIEKRRDLQAVYNPRTRAQVLGYAPGFPWEAFFAAQQLGKRQDFVLNELTAVRDLAALFGATPLPVLRDFLTFHYLDSNAAYLPKRFDEARFAFYGQALREQPQQRERWKRGVDAVNGAMGEAVGRLYVAGYFPAESKARVQQLVANLRAALAARLQALPWMTPPTRERALAKLAAFTPKVGYPDKWKDYSSLEVRRDDPLGNARRAAQWDWDYQVARLDKPVDRAEWGLTPQTINAEYIPTNNSIEFPAAILQPPFFDPNADDAVNYGGIGAVIGHEIGHGFDDQGRKFGPNGAMHDWWTPADDKEFSARTKRLVTEFSGFEALPGLKVNGASNLGENIGDLGGLNMALAAYHMSLHGKPAPVLDGLTGDQRFFMSWAQVWRTKFRDGYLREQVLSDVHSPDNFRVNGSVPNVDEWYSAFGVQPGDKLYIAPAQRVRIW